METYRIRYVGGVAPASAIALVRELVGVGLRAAKELVDTRGVLLANVSAAEARVIEGRFIEIGAEVEVEPNDSPNPADAEMARLEEVSARDRSMEAELRERPDDVAAHLIYGDWLQARGDPRGELVMLQHACEQATESNARAELRAREQEFRRQHLGHLFGPLHELADALVVRWSRGFIDAAFVGVALGPEYGPTQVLQHLLRLPIAARMTSLGINTTTLHRPRLEEVLCASEAIEGLRELELTNWALPSPSKLWPKLAKLRKLTIHNDAAPLQSLHSATLEHLEWHILSDCHATSGPSAADRVPRLRTLTLVFPLVELVTPTFFGWLLSVPEFVGVRELIVCVPNVEIPLGLAQALATAALAQLDVLDLSRCVADAEVIEMLIAGRERGVLPKQLHLPARSPTPE